MRHVQRNALQHMHIVPAKVVTAVDVFYGEGRGGIGHRHILKHAMSESSAGSIPLRCNGEVASGVILSSVLP